MINLNDILETIQMINQENLDIRTVTMGISLLIAPIRIFIVLVKKFTKRLHAWQVIWYRPDAILKQSTGSRLSTSVFLLPLLQC